MTNDVIEKIVEAKDKPVPEETILSNLEEESEDLENINLSAREKTN